MDLTEFTSNVIGRQLDKEISFPLLKIVLSRNPSVLLGLEVPKYLRVDEDNSHEEGRRENPKESLSNHQDPSHES